MSDCVVRFLCRDVNPTIKNASLHKIKAINHTDVSLPLDACIMHVTGYHAVRKRITFKLVVLVFKCLHGLAPPYLETYCTTTSSTAGRSHLRSAKLCQLTVPRTKTCYGDRSFSVSGPAVWNSLPAALRCDDVTRLKAALFNT